MLSNVPTYLRIVGGLVKLMHQPCTPERAKSLVRSRMATREQLFLQMLREGVWEHPGSPYRRMLVAAGWSFDSVAESVRRHGLENTLEMLRDAGVYVSQDEGRGRKPIQRNGLTIQISSERDFDNPRVVPAFEMQTGGTRSHGTTVPSSLDYIATQRAVAWCLSLDAMGVSTWPVVVWMTRGAGFLWWLSLAHMNRPPVRWFSTSDLSVTRTPRLHQIMIRVGQAVGMTRGMRLPFLENVPLSDSSMVLDAILQTRARHGRCVVVTTPSAATRLAGLADSRGVDLENTAFLVGGEPLTPSKYAEISRTGARVGARYNLTEAGAVGGTCGYPTDPDDVHLMADNVALIPHRRTLPDGTSVDAFLLTILLPSAPGVALNLESDDFGQITVRRCGCIWDELGIHTHLSNIRSFSKLTGEGVTVLGTECVRIIEEVLPREFGGSSTDYQLLEVEDTDHLTRLHLIVRPSVGPLREDLVLSKFISALRDTDAPGQIERWLQAGSIKVVRQEPVATATGKLLPFHTLAFTLRGSPRGSADGKASAHHPSRELERRG